MKPTSLGLMCRTATMLLGFAALDAAVAQTRPNETKRARFLASSSLGEFAVVAGARNTANAVDKNNYLVFPAQGACYLIDPADTYYFALNTRGSGNQDWASFVTVIYHNGASAGDSLLYRNGGWLARGTRRAHAGAFSRSFAEIGLTPEKFIQYHMAALPGWSAMSRAAPEFHGVVGSVDSWDRRQLFTQPLLRHRSRMAGLAVNLYRFRMTTATPHPPMIFPVQRRGSTTFTVRADTPGTDGPPIPYERTFTTSSRCTAR